MTPSEIAARLRALADEIEKAEKPELPIIPADIQETGPVVSAANPYVDSSAMIPLKSDDHLIASPKIMDNIMSSRYWRIYWQISHQAKVPLLILRGAHPDGCMDFEYPKKPDGTLDRDAMDRLRDAFREIAVPHYPPGQEWRDTSPADLRVGSDVWSTAIAKHISIDDKMFHRFDSVLYSHGHMDVRTP
ncbi:MAG: hypothetical protein PHV74_14005 [Dehalococcoidia bacterium]|nr:hypothetical protein [Dehalococcoidia bacterium]